MKEKSLYRSIKKEIRAQELLRQSRLPSSMQHRQQHTSKCRRSMSASDLARLGREEYTFKPKTNGYHIPDYDRQHAKFLEQCEEAKRMRPTTKCQPFLLHTDLISSKRDRVLDDIRHDETNAPNAIISNQGKTIAAEICIRNESIGEPSTARSDTDEDYRHSRVARGIEQEETTSPRNQIPIRSEFSKIQIGERKPITRAYSRKSQIKGSIGRAKREESRECKMRKEYCDTFVLPFL